MALLDLVGATVILDVIGCQKDLAQRIRSQQTNDVLTVKENQLTLRVTDLHGGAPGAVRGLPHTAHRTVDGGHECIAIGRGWALDDSKYLRYVDPQGHRPDLRSLLLVGA